MQEKLVELAIQARKNAYAPYSKFTVGAALQTNSGSIYTGCNVENVSYGATICAERTAICKMISEGENTISAICIASETGCTPCGMCLQVILEFASQNEDISIVLVDKDSTIRRTSMKELLPHPFHTLS